MKRPHIAEYEVLCHVCGKETDVTRAVNRLNSDGYLQLAGQNCDHCGSKNTLVITMMSGLQVLETLQKNKSELQPKVGCVCCSNLVSKEEARDLTKSISEALRERSK
jgi:hypothetical protein